MPEQCPWCGARESGIGRLGDPFRPTNFTCSKTCKRKDWKPRKPAPEWLVRMTLDALSNNLWYSKPAQAGMKIGDTIQIRRPARYLSA